MTTLSPINESLDSEESWSAARRFAALLLPIPPAVAHALQLLWAEHLDSKEVGQMPVKATTIHALRIIEKSNKLKLPIYFAATALFPDKLAEASEDDTVKALIEVLGPGLFAAFLAMVYMHRRLNKICTDAQWETLSKELVLNMELGFLVGSAVPKLGAAEGTLAGGIRYAGISPFLIATPDHFMRYRNSKKRQFDLAHEHKTWGCDHTQIGAFILKEMCVSLDLRKNSHSLRKFEDNELCTLDGELKSWRSALRFIDAIKQNSDPFAASVELSLSTEEMVALKEKTSSLFQGKSKFGWMFKSSKSENEVEESE